MVRARRRGLVGQIRRLITVLALYFYCSLPAHSQADSTTSTPSSTPSKLLLKGSGGQAIGMLFTRMARMYNQEVRGRSASYPLFDLTYEAGKSATGWQRLVK